jgi:hypothetical protein
VDHPSAIVYSPSRSAARSLTDDLDHPTRFRVGRRGFGSLGGGRRGVLGHDMADVSRPKSFHRVFSSFLSLYLSLSLIGLE